MCLFLGKTKTGWKGTLFMEVHADMSDSVCVFIAQLYIQQVLHLSIYVKEKHIFWKEML